MNVLRAVIATILIVAAAGAAQAAADLELGRYLAQECVTCHRSATAASTIPNIAGVPEGTLADKIKAYRDKKLDNAVMQTIAARLKDDEIEALAAYFAGLKRP